MSDRNSVGDDASSDKPGKMLRQIMHLGINGVGGLSGAKELGDKYMQNPAYQTKMERIEAIAKREEIKNFSSGFLTSLGGIISLPIAIPASLGINWILQTRMVAAMAHVGGFDIDDPPVRMTIALCLLGKKGREILSRDIEEAMQNLKIKSLSQIPKRTILVVNQAVGVRLMQAAASKGFTRLSKAIPVLGGVVGGFLDYQSCRETAQFAKELFQFHKGIEIHDQNNEKC